MELEVPPPLASLVADPARIGRAMTLWQRLEDLQAEYRPWRKVRHIAKQRGLDPTDAWLALKLSRRGQSLPLLQASGNRFHWCAGNHLHEPLHRIDRACGGGGPASLASERGILFDEGSRTRFQIKSLMDEAAESAIIEGAATTRKDAVEMLRAKREPRSNGERMVVNNFVAMQKIKRLVDKSLTPDMLLDLQGILTEGTLSEPDGSRRWRRPDENVRVTDERTNEVIYTPPPAAGLADRIRRLCDFANAPHLGSQFIHPVVKACILHFMIGYEHPFIDGNGRTARAVFYWFALKHQFWIFEYIPISDRIRAGYARYPQAYLDSELDDGDLTHFILYKLDIIEQALDSFAVRLRREEDKIKRSERMLKLAKDLNLRQRLLLEHALRHPATRYTRRSHATSHRITLATAAADLDTLVRRRLMTTSKDGKEIIYHPIPELAMRVANGSKKK